MWQRLAKLVLQFRLPLLIMLLAATIFMGYLASKVQLSYEFARAIPVDNPKYKEYLSFKKKFGDDGNLLVIAVQTDSIFELNTFKAFTQLHKDLKKVNNVEDVLSLISAINLVKNFATEKLSAIPIFDTNVTSQQQLDSSKNVFLQLPFYRGNFLSNKLYKRIVLS